MENIKIVVETLTKYFLGQIVEQNNDYIKLKDCSWVADTGRFTQFVSNGEINELEVFPPKTIVTIPLNNVVCYYQWKYDLPTKQK